jgi:ankyrin repeat protein
MVAPPDSPLPLPERPDLRHLKGQAKDLLREGGARTLSRAQLLVARRYGFPSWPKLKAHVESLREIGQLKEAIDAEDLERVIDLMTRSPALHRAPLGYSQNGPLTSVAECRIPRRMPTATRLEMARWMIEHGSDVHQGGDGPLMRAALADERIPMMELLVARGADVNALWAGHYPIICAPCEALAPRVLAWLLERGADPSVVAEKYGNPAAMVIGTYSRDAPARQECLEVLARAGVALPDTPCMALHRGRLDLLEAHLRRDSLLLERRFTDAEIYPAELGIAAGDGLTATPVDGGTLLHVAVELVDIRGAEWLLAHGADPNARAAADPEGFGDHTPLYHAVVVLACKNDEIAPLLLRHGADPNVRSTLRKQLRDMRKPEQEAMREFRDVTPIGYTRAYIEPAWVNEPAVAALEAAGGR